MSQELLDTTVSVLAGLTPRGITELFNILDRDSGKYTFSVSCYMLELYQDDLADLLLPASQKQQGPQKVLNQCDSLLVLPFCMLVSATMFASSQFTLLTAPQQSVAHYLICSNLSSLTLYASVRGLRFMEIKY